MDFEGVMVATTILRGDVVVEKGAFHGDLRHGRFLKRKVAAEMRSRPGLWEYLAPSSGMLIRRRALAGGAGEGHPLPRWTSSSRRSDA